MASRQGITSSRNGCDVRGGHVAEYILVHAAQRDVSARDEAVNLI
jgi:hypothetical protein